jgi:hypothetical protein
MSAITTYPFVSLMREGGLYSNTFVSGQSLGATERLVGYPDISNDVGSVKHIFGRTSPFHSEGVVWNPFAFRPSIDDHGSFVIFRPVSVRPKHLFDPYFDHDYLFKLPL